MKHTSPNSKPSTVTYRIFSVLNIVTHLFSDSVISAAAEGFCGGAGIIYVLSKVPDFVHQLYSSNVPTIFVTVLGLCALVVTFNVLWQLLVKNKHEPPVVFHLFPFIGSTVSYGSDPYAFFRKCQAKYGDCFTFILLGRKTTVCLGSQGNHFILNGKLQDLNAEEIYSPLTTPVFGSGVVYDCSNAKLMEQKRMLKFGLTSDCLRSYVPLITSEVESFIKTSPHFQTKNGICDIPVAMAELTLYTAARCLQGIEVRSKFDSTFADLYHDLDMGFSPINFILPWAPLPHNIKRDFAQQKLAQTYAEIIQARRSGRSDEQDMIWHLMNSSYKDGTPLSDKEMAHMLIALLMAGQHSSSATVAWIMIRLASRPEIIEDLYQEQVSVLGSSLPDLTYDDLSRLRLHGQVVSETLRLHAPIHSIMRKVKNPMVLPQTGHQIPPSHVLLSAPGTMSRDEQYFHDPMTWEPQRWGSGPGQQQQQAKGTNEGEERELIDYGYGAVSKSASSSFLPFGAGRHRCIGEQFAYMQLTTITALMVRHFRWKQPCAGTPVVGTDYSSLFSRPLTPAKISWRKRNGRSVSWAPGTAAAGAA